MTLTPHLLYEERLILQILTDNPLWGNLRRPARDELDGERLLSLLNQHKLMRFFAHKARQQRLDIPLSTSRTLKQLLILADIETQVYRETLNRINRIFSREGITYCLIKGHSLGPPDCPRDVNDLDILISDADLEKSDRVLRESGFYFAGDDRKAYMKKRDCGGDFTYLKRWSNQFEYRNNQNDLLLEIHTHFFERERVYPFNMERIWAISDPILKQSVLSPALACPVLQPAHSLWLIAMHNAFRRTASKYMLTLRYMGDMHYLITRDRADWNDFLDITSQTETEGFALYSLEMTEYFYPKTVPEEICNRLRARLSVKKRFFLFIQHRCLLNLVESRRLYTILYQIFLPYIYGGRLKDKLSVFFIGLKVLKPPVWRLIRERKRVRMTRG